MRLLSRPLKGCLGVILGITCAAALHAQIPVGPGGSSATLTFDTLPLGVTNWSVLSIAGGAGDITDAGTLDTAVINNTDAAAITGALTAHGTEPPAQNATPRWNSAGLYLQTRPTGNGYQILMARVQNGTGADQNQIVVTYDFAQRNNIPVNESVAGHRLYYSLTGAPGSWVAPPEFPVFDNSFVAQNISVAIPLASPWVNTSNIFIIWVDDNGPGSTTDPMEGAYTIDNVVFSLTAVPPEVHIVTQPADTTVVEGQSVTFQVVASGRAPLSYQWFRGGVPIDGATAASYTIPRVFRSDSGATFSVQINNDVPSSETSRNAVLTVTPDNTGPRILYAYGTNDNVTLFVVFSEIVTNAADAANYSVFLTGDPATTLLVASATYADPLATEGNVIVLTLDPNSPWVPPNSYSMNAGAIFDVIGNPNDPAQIVSISLYDDTFFAISPTKNWSYLDPRAEPPAGWNTFTFNDSAWASGPAVLGIETAAMPEPLRTQLTLGGITYYFRTHFNYSGPAGTGIVRFRTILDDSAIIYLNGVEISRMRMGAGPASYSTEGIGGAVGDGNYEGPFTILVTNLRSGDNVIAAEVHQIGTGSSDLAWGMEFGGVTDAIDPLTLVSQPAGTNVVEPAPFTLRIEVRGSSPQYQWYHNDAPIAGANASTYTVNPSDCEVHSGEYYVIVTNAAPSSITSQRVNVRVDCDLTPPAIACVYGTNDVLVVVFNENVTMDWSTAAFNFAIHSQGGAPLALTVVTNTSGTNFGTTILATIDPSTPRDPGLAYSVDISGVEDMFQNPIAPISVSVPWSAGAPLLSLTGQWRYNTSGTDLGTAWSAAAFNDSAWPQGNALFDAKRPQRTNIFGVPVATQTTLSNAANTAQIPTHYFRTHFNYSGSPGATLELNAMVDDGTVWYLNGEEIFRNRMPAAPAAVNYTTLATATVGDATNEFFYVCVDNLVSGDNVLAVELHQQALDSSDLTFAAQVSVYSATPAPPSARLTITRGAGNQINISWTGSGVLQESSNLSTHPNGWSNVAGVVGNSYQTTSAGGNRFFRLAPNP
jgi:hypothetical protein